MQYKYKYKIWQILKTTKQKSYVSSSYLMSMHSRLLLCNTEFNSNYKTYTMLK